MGRLRPELTNRVAVFRIANGLTQEQLAQAVNVSRQTIVALEGGAYSPSTVLALRLSILLGTTVDELFKLSDEMSLELQHQRKIIINAHIERQQSTAESKEKK